MQWSRISKVLLSAETAETAETPVAVFSESTAGSVQLLSLAGDKSVRRIGFHSPPEQSLFLFRCVISYWTTHVQVRLWTFRCMPTTSLPNHTRSVWGT